MITVTDFFNSKKCNEPYIWESEYIDDMLMWLDMVFGIALDIKEGECAQPVYLRGSSVTYEEVKRLTRNTNLHENTHLCGNTQSNENAQLPENAHLPENVKLPEKSTLPDEVKQQIYYVMEYIHLRIEATEKFSHISRLWEIVSAYRMDMVERTALWLCCAPLYDKKYERIYAFLNNSITINKPTSAILKSIYYLIGESNEIDDVNKLICGSSELIRINQNDEITIPECIYSYLLGGELSTEKFSPYYHQLYDDGEVIANKDIYQKLSSYVKSNVGYPSVVNFQAGQGMGKKLFTTHLCGEMGLGVVGVWVEKLMTCEFKNRECVLREILAACTISKSFVYLELCGMEYDKSTTEEILNIIEKLLERYRFVFIGTNEHLPSEICQRFPILEVVLNSVDSISRVLLWEKSFNGKTVDEKINMDEIAGKYLLSPYEIMIAGKQAEMMSRYNGRSSILEKDIRQAISLHSRSFRSQFATKIESKFTWDDLIVNRKIKNKLMLACDRLKHRYILNEKYGLSAKYSYGTGISVLLYGPPGTGKTMSAQIIANEVGLDIYRIDISQITSKYVGETEKNLSDIFNEARNSNLILFFDEADSLFAKRTEIHDSNDKYSNAETSYILQKIEEYDGMCILATNLLTNFDPALMRRITYAIGFEAPDADTRYQLWTGIFGDMLNIDKNIDFHFFAEKFEFSGSSIKAILYNAACLAVSDDSQIGIKHIALALKYEYEKLGKFFNAGMLESYSSYLLED